MIGRMLACVLVLTVLVTTAAHAFVGASVPGESMPHGIAVAMADSAKPLRPDGPAGALGAAPLPATITLFGAALVVLGLVQRSRH